MSYEPTNWKSGDTVTSAKLNKMEQGIANAGGGILLVGMNTETMALDKTWQEIHDAGFAVIHTEFIPNQINLMPLVIIKNTDSLYSVTFSESDPVEFTATSADGYPVAQG